MAATKPKATKRATKVRTSWVKKQSPEKQKESRKRAWAPKMSKPLRNYTPMEAYLREHEYEDSDPPNTVRLMDEFQEQHSKSCIAKEIARVTTDGITHIWYGCSVCGNVIRKRK